MPQRISSVANFIKRNVFEYNFPSPYSDSFLSLYVNSENQVQTTNNNIRAGILFYGNGGVNYLPNGVDFTDNTDEMEAAIIAGFDSSMTPNGTNLSFITRREYSSGTRLHITGDGKVLVGDTLSVGNFTATHLFQVNGAARVNGTLDVVNSINSSSLTINETLNSNALHINQGNNARYLTFGNQGFTTSTTGVFGRHSRDNNLDLAVLEVVNLTLSGKPNREVLTCIPSANQLANIQSWRNSSGGVLASINNAGNWLINTTTDNGAKLQVNGRTTISNNTGSTSATTGALVVTGGVGVGGGIVSGGDISTGAASNLSIISRNFRGEDQTAIDRGGNPVEIRPGNGTGFGFPQEIRFSTGNRGSNNSSTAHPLFQRMKIVGNTGHVIFGEQTAITPDDLVNRLQVDGSIKATRYTTPQQGASPPSFNTRSAGTKLVLWEQLSATSTDYALGIQDNSTWFTLPQNSSTYAYRFYGGTTEVASISGTGLLTANQFKLSALNTAPTSSTDTGTPGEIKYSENFISVCTAPNTWKSVELNPHMANATLSVEYLYLENANTEYTYTFTNVKEYSFKAIGGDIRYATEAGNVANSIFPYYTLNTTSEETANFGSSRYTGTLYFASSNPNTYIIFLIQS